MEKKLFFLRLPIVFVFLLSINSFAEVRNHLNSYGSRELDLLESCTYDDPLIDLLLNFHKGSTYRAPGSIRIDDFDNVGNNPDHFFEIDERGLRFKGVLKYNIYLPEEREYTFNINLTSVYQSTDISIKLVDMSFLHKKSHLLKLHIPYKHNNKDPFMVFSKPVKLPSGKYRLEIQTKNASFTMNAIEIFNVGKSHVVPTLIPIDDFDVTGPDKEERLEITTQDVVEQVNGEWQPVPYPIMKRIDLVDKVMYNIEILRSGEYSVRFREFSKDGDKSLNVAFLPIDSHLPDADSSNVRIPWSYEWSVFFATYTDRPIHLSKGHYKLVIESPIGGFNLSQIEVLSTGKYDKSNLGQNKYEFDPGDEWELVLSDDFSRNDLNQNNWTVENQLNPPNNELQKYLESFGGSNDNVRIENGKLVIEAQFSNKSYPGKHNNADEYSSGRINSEFKQSFKYGRFEARIKLPEAVGLWPAFWLMGDNFTGSPEREHFWPECGEIDILESNGDFLQAALQRGRLGGNWQEFERFDTKEKLGIDLREDYHVYAIEWDEYKIKWYVDDQLFYTNKNISLPGTDNDNFYFPFGISNDDKFFIILNLAVGGWIYKEENRIHVPKGYFPAQMKIDYIRYYKKK